MSVCHQSEPLFYFDRTIEQNGLKQAAQEEGKGIIAFSPLAQGMLTDRYLNGIPADSRVNTDGRFLKKEQLTDSKIHQIQALNEIAKQRGESLAQMALKWVLKDEVVTSVLIGASRPQQILDNIKVIESAGFTEEELRLIDEVSVEKEGLICLMQQESELRMSDLLVRREYIDRDRCG